MKKFLVSLIIVSGIFLLGTTIKSNAQCPTGYTHVLIPLVGPDTNGCYWSIEFCYACPGIQPNGDIYVKNLKWSGTCDSVPDQDWVDQVILNNIGSNCKSEPCDPEPEQ